MIHPSFTTPRLFLRTLQDSDDASILSLRSNDEVNKYIDRPNQTTIEEAQAFIQKIKTGTAEGKSFYWGIALKDQPGIIGIVCLWNLSADGTSAEMGYELHPDFQGKGYMQEALQAVIEFSFHTAGISVLEAFTHYDNKASSKLLVKYGFVLNGERKDADNENIIIFELVRQSG